MRAVNIPLTAVQGWAVDLAIRLTALLCDRKIFLLSKKLLQVCQWEAILLIFLAKRKHQQDQYETKTKIIISTNQTTVNSLKMYLDSLIGVSDEGNKERQHHVNEQGDEGVEVGSAEEPHQCVFILELCKGGKHIIPI